MRSGDVYKLQVVKNTYGVDHIYFIIIGWVDDECEISVVDNPYDDHILKLKMDCLEVTNTLTKKTIEQHLSKFTYIRHYDETYELKLENRPIVR